MNVPKLRFSGFNEEWHEYKMGDILNIKNGLNKEKECFGTGTPIINYMDINKNEILTREKIKGLVSLNKKEIETFKVKKGDIFFTRTSETSEEIGLSASLVDNIDFCVFSGFVLKGSQKENYIFPYFGGYYFRNPRMRNEIIKHSSITTRALTSGTLLSQMNIYLPSIQEQERIGNFLFILDKKIELQTKKIEALKLFKSCTKNEIFKNGNHVCKLGAILNKWNEKNKDGAINYVESISNKAGFIPQSEQFEDRNVASKNLRNYYVIKKGVFGYNPSRLNVGSLALKENDSISVVSPLYECFTTTQNNTYLFEWFNSNYFKKETSSRFEGGVRNTLNFNNLCDIPINLPDIETQNQYAKYFNKLNFKISLEEQNLSELVKFKKGLLQDMFI